MNLRKRAVALSLAPLVLMLLLAVPEALLQRQAVSATAAAQHTAAVAEAASNVLNARVVALLAARRLVDGAAHDGRAYDTASAAFEQAAIRLAAVVGDSEPSGSVKQIAVSFSAMDRILDRIAALGLARRRDAALALYDGPAYAAALVGLEDTIGLFAQHARELQDAQAVSMQRLWNSSLLIFVVGVVAVMAVATLSYIRAARLVSAIVGLVGKTERYRSGEPLGERSTSRDELGLLDGALHDLVAAQHEREQQLRLYRLQAEVTSDAILFIDRADLTIIDANPAALLMYGHERLELLGTPTARLHALEDPLDYAALARSDSRTGLMYEGLHQRADGTAFPVEVRARSAEFGGRAVIVKTIRDISERRRGDEQLANALAQAVDASRLKSEFVATMSHELRTPMHGVIGVTELLLQTELTERQRDYAVTMRDSASALLAIVDDVLDFSKLEAGKVELEPVVFDPREVVHTIMAIARGALGTKSLVLHSSVSPHVPTHVRGDLTRVRQVLLNLVGNAVKFTEQGVVDLRVSVERDDGKAIVLEFAVDDTGIGVAPAAREHLFDAFVQGDGSTTRRYGGSGLGLSICRRLVELMGGRIWLGEKSEPGSTFAFTVRLERTDETAAFAEPPPGSLRVLVIDGDDAVHGMLGVAVNSWGMSVVAVTDADTARGRLRAAVEGGDPFDVVIVDFVLPRTNGVALAAEIGKDPDFGRPACVLVSAFDAVGRREAALDAGCVAYLTKPIDPSELYAVLAGVEQRRRPPAAEPEEPLAAAAPCTGRVLLVEDSALVRHVAQLQLSELGLAADVAVSGAEALRATGEREYDLILMDVRMPGMDGLETTRAIRAGERRSGRHTVVIALTANVQAADREACMEAGMDGFLTKPLRLDALRDVLERWLPQRV